MKQVELCEISELGKWARAGNGPQGSGAHLVRIAVQVEVFQESGGKLAEEGVVRLVDCP